MQVSTSRNVAVGAVVARHGVALGRGLVLTALAIAGPAMAFLNIVATLLVAVGLVPVHLAAVGGARRLANLSRHLAYEWGGVAIPGPSYRPGPPAPARRPDGWYEYDGTLYKSPRIPAMLLRMRWISQDPATVRDFLWMVANPLVGGPLAVLPPALVGCGALGLLAPGLWPGAVSDPIVRISATVAVVVGLAAGPVLLRLHARWTRILLRPSTGPCVPSGLGRRATALRHCLALAGLSVACLAMFAVHLLALLVAWGGGQAELMVFSRRLTNTYRRLAGDWTGLNIPEPYLPKPAPPEPGFDGRYRYGRKLHTDPGAIVRAQGVGWVLRDRATWRDLAWMLTSPVVGVLLVVPVALAAFGFFGLIWQPLWWPLWGPALWLFGDVWISPWRVWEPVATLGPALDAIPGVVSPVIGAAMTLLGILTAPPLVRLHISYSRLLLGPTEHALLAQRVHRLTETRADATETQAAELRRIERDLHDGAQARLVAMGMTLGAIEQLVEDDPAAAKELVAKTRETSAQALHELRELVRGIHPPVLAERGLGDAVRALAMDSPLAVEVSVDLPGRPESPVESAAYFAVSEALTNATRHTGADRVWVDIRHDGETLRMTVTDDGGGGAVATPGGGLHGIERRLGTFDGVLALSSPPGGPTTVTMEIPCALFSPRTSTS